MKKMIRCLYLGLALLVISMAGLTVTHSAHAGSQYWIQRMNWVARHRVSDHYPSINWNARDLGGYPAGHGYRTRSDKVFRGGNLKGISNAGINQMKALNIRKVIDLRSYHHQGGADPQEGARHNRLGVIYREYPVNTYRQKLNLRYYKTRYGGEAYKYGAPFTTYRTARQAYRDVFDQLLRNQRGAIYFHCIQGRDRTGIMSALYLSALGVSRYNIFDDFLMTNYYKHRYTYHSQSQELNRFFNTIDHYYGDTHNYLRRGLGLSNRQLNRLKAKYLVKK